MTVVIDASTVVAALIDSGPDGEWAEQFLAVPELAAPHLMPAEVTNIVRRSLMKGLITSDVASLALADLDAIQVQLFEFSPFAARVWELRNNVTSYDAWYIALAEAVSAPVATLDVRLSRAVGPHCEFVTRPPG
jgi:predicted nucleic acid-binding protein